MALALAGCTVVSLRPIGAHGPLRRAAAIHGARVLALSPWRIRQRNDDTTRDALAAALAAPVVVFTSPAAVAAARRLSPLRGGGATWLAVGAGTAAALRRAGANAMSPARMDTEGLLALPQLRDIDGRTVGLVTAPGGRGELAPELARRGARVLRADVYERVPVPTSPRAVATLRALEGTAWLALSSGAALSQVLAELPPDARKTLLAASVVAASERLAALARAHGFSRCVVASSARPRDLVAAAAAAHPLA